MAPKQGGKRIPEYVSRETELQRDAFPMFLDPNRPDEYRSDGADVQDQRRVWRRLPLTPFRFRGDAIPAYDEVLRSFVDEGLIQRLTAVDHDEKLQRARDIFARGVRIDREFGCIIPSQTQVNNRRHIDVFEAVYGYRLVATVEGRSSRHNLNDDPAAPAPGRQRPDYNGHYRTYVRRDDGHPAQLVVEWSHLCHIPFCMNPTHVVVEIKIINNPIRHDCAGVVQGTNHCACMQSFVEWNRLSPESINELVPCLRSPQPVRNIQATEWGVPAPNYPRQAECLPGPFKEELEPDVLRRRVEQAARTLCLTGMTFENLPHLFIDLRVVDAWMRQQLGAVAAGGSTAHHKRRQYSDHYHSKCMERVFEIKRLVHDERERREQSRQSPGVIEGGVNNVAASQLSEPLVDDDSSSEEEPHATYVSPPGADTPAPKRRGPKKRERE